MPPSPPPPIFTPMVNEVTRSSAFYSGSSSSQVKSKSSHGTRMYHHCVLFVMLQHPNIIDKSNADYHYNFIHSAPRTDAGSWSHINLTHRRRNTIAFCSFVRTSHSAMGDFEWDDMSLNNVAILEWKGIYAL